MRRLKVSTVPLLLLQARSIGLPEPVTELRFHPSRLWRFDVAWKPEQIALEVNGALFVGGRHSRGVGQEKDYEKLAEAACLGWRVLQVSPRQVTNGQAIGWVERLMKGTR